MFVVKVTHQDTTRRFVMEVPYSFSSLSSLISTRFELSEQDKIRSSLSYVDPDGDVISMNTNDELLEALRLLKEADPPLLRLKLHIGSTDRVNSSTPALAQEQSSCVSDSDSVVVVDEEKEEKVEGDDQQAAAEQPQATEEVSVVEENQAVIEEDAELAAVMAASLKEAEEAAKRAEMERAAQEEAKRVAAEEEAARLALEEEAKRAELEMIAAEEAKRAAAEEKKARMALEEEAKRVAAEEEAKRVAAVEEVKLAVAEEGAKLAAEEEERERLARLKVARAHAQEECMYRAAQLFNMGCSIDVLRTIFSEQLLESVALARENEEAPSAAAAPAPVEELPMPIVADEPLNVVAVEAAAAPVESPEVKEVAAPEQVFVMEEEAVTPNTFALRLEAFYAEHNPAGLDRLPTLVSDFFGKEETLNTLLRKKYGVDLTCIVLDNCVVKSKAVFESEPVPEPEAAGAQAEPVNETETKFKKELEILAGMGFSNVETNLELLVLHDGDVSKVVEELINAA